MTVILAGLAAGLWWGAADFIAGSRSRRAGVMAVVVLSQLAGLALMMPLMPSLAGSQIAPRDIVLGLVAGAFEGVAVLALYRALAIGSMGLVAPIAALGGALPIGAAIIGGERPGPLAAAGAALALVAAVIAARAPGPVARQGLGLALLAAVSFGAFFLVLGHAGDEGALPVVLYSRVGSVALVIVVALAVRASLAVTRTDLGPIILIGGLDVAASLAFVLASRAGLASVAVGLGSLYPVATVLLARVVLRERLTPAQASSVLVACAGVALIAMS